MTTQFKCKLRPKDLKEWMKAYGMDPVDVASRLGVSEKTVRRFLAGITNPHLLVLKSIQELVAAGDPNIPTLPSSGAV